MAALLFMFGTGCATLISGKNQELSFTSVPDGATVTVDGRALGKTPLTTNLKKRSGQALVFTKDGYKTATFRLDTRMDSWFWGNIVVGGFVGSTTDHVSGAVNEYSPSQYMVTLEPLKAGQFAQSSRPERQKAKDFIVVGYRQILGDLKKGSGEYLSSLLNLLSVETGQRTAAVKKILALSEAYADIPDFADHVVDMFLRPAVSASDSAVEEEHPAKAEVDRLVKLHAAKNYRGLQDRLDELSSTVKGQVVSYLKTQKRVQKLTADEIALVKWIKAHRPFMWD